MGLDLYFNKQKAIDAGLIITEEPNGTPEEIAEHQEQDPGYAGWLAQTSEIVQVPNADHCVCACTSGDELSIRANHWGPTYAPLTTWLKQNNIEWGEY